MYKMKMYLLRTIAMKTSKIMYAKLLITVPGT